MLDDGGKFGIDDNFLDPNMDVHSVTGKWKGRTTCEYVIPDVAGRNCDDVVHKSNECTYCGASFGSRNALFRHLRETCLALQQQQQTLQQRKQQQSGNRSKLLLDASFDIALPSIEMAEDSVAIHHKHWRSKKAKPSECSQFPKDLELYTGERFTIGVYEDGEEFACTDLDWRTNLVPETEP